MADQENDAAPHPLLPPATQRELEDQTTPELTREARRHARERVKLLRWAGIPVSRIYARELVDDAYADTWAGVLPWDPSRSSLLDHLRQAIKRRTWLEIRRGRRVTFVGLHEPANDEAEPEQIVSEEVERVLADASHRKCSPILLHAMLATLCQELQAHVAHDHEAAGVVQCWENGVVERDKIMELNGLTAVAYERVRKRLLYMSRRLSSELREAVQDLLRNAA